MKVIKNFSIKSESVKNKILGLSKYINHLEHKEHNTTKIISFGLSSKTFVTNVAAEAASLEYYRISNNISGRSMQSYAQSFVLSLKTTTQELTKEQWETITAGVIKDTAKFIGVDPKEIVFFANAHNQSNTKLNIIFSKIINGEKNRDINGREINAIIKKAFNRGVLNNSILDCK